MPNLEFYELSLLLASDSQRPWSIAELERERAAAVYL